MGLNSRWKRLCMALWLETQKSTDIAEKEYLLLYPCIVHILLHCDTLHSEYGTFKTVVPLGLRYYTECTMVLHVMALFVHLSLLEQLTFRIWYA